MQTLPIAKGKSESVTFRIDSKSLKNLRHEAEQKDVSTNMLVNQIIKDHLNWHSNAAKAGFVAVRRPFVTRVINNLSEQEIISLAEYVAKAANKDAILLMKREYTIKSALDFIEYWIKISGYPYRHEETNNGANRHAYIIQHDMGKKWSLYLASLYQILFEELGVNKKIEFDKTENTLAFTIDSD
ncbi:MAG TPA: hypothetical protein VJ729_07160 [Nitrososphaeraceae archaeon]|nr:hypothetical protein [Nitrososphaeraceae archaeon]